MKKLIVLAAIFSIASTVAYAAQRDFEPEDMVEIIVASKKGLLDEAVTTINPHDMFRDFELPDLGGNPVKTEDLRKNKIFIIRFINLHDVYSVGQRKVFETILNEHRDEIAILDIISKEDEHTLEVVFSEYENSQITYTVVLDKKGIAAEKYGLKVTPAVFIFDKDGKHFATLRILNLATFDKVYKAMTEKPAPEKK